MTPLHLCVGGHTHLCVCVFFRPPARPTLSALSSPYSAPTLLSNFSFKSNLNLPFSFQIEIQNTIVYRNPLVPPSPSYQPSPLALLVLLVPLVPPSPPNPPSPS